MLCERSRGREGVRGEAFDNGEIKKSEASSDRNRARASKRVFWVSQDICSGSHI